MRTNICYACTDLRHVQQVISFLYLLNSLTQLNTKQREPIACHQCLTWIIIKLHIDKCSRSFDVFSYLVTDRNVPLKVEGVAKHLEKLLRISTETKRMT